MGKDVPNTKILFLASNPKGMNKRRLDEEVQGIQEGLRQAQYREWFTIESQWAVRPKDIRRKILNFRPNIVHFSGHGAADGGLAFENEAGQAQSVSPNALSGLFKLCSDHVQCVVLNACYSRMHADAIAQHISFVIGMSRDIEDKAAIEFSVGFYDALGAGHSVEFAYEVGCNAIHMAGMQENLTPILRTRKKLSSCGESIPPLDNRHATMSHEKRSKHKVATLTPVKVQYEFVLSGQVDEVDKKRLEAIVLHLREITGDTTLTFLKVEPGSIKITLEGSEEGFQRLQKLVESGKLSQVESFDVLSVDRKDDSFSTLSSVTPSATTADNVVADSVHRKVVFNALSDTEDTDKTVEILTVDLVEKAFVLGIRTMIKVRCMRDEFLALGYREQADAIYRSTKNALSDTYSIRTLNKETVEGSDTSVIELFEEIADDIFNTECTEKVDTSREAFEEHQHKFINLVVRMVAIRSGIVDNFEQGIFNETLNTRLDEVAVANLKRLKDTYMYYVKSQDSEQLLSDISVQTREQIMGDVLAEIEQKSESLIHINNQLDEESSSVIVRILEKLLKDRKNESLSNRNTLAAEAFLIGLRRAISIYQQLNILSSVLDKVNALYVFMESIELRLLSIQQSREALERRATIEEQEREAEKLKESSNPCDVIAGEFISQVSAHNIEDHELLNNKLIRKFNELVSEIDIKLKIFESKSRTANDINAALFKMASFSRIYHTAIVKESGESKAPFTQELVHTVSECTNAIKSISSRSNDMLLELSP